jgi:hypothetical protein
MMADQYPIAANVVVVDAAGWRMNRSAISLSRKLPLRFWVLDRTRMNRFWSFDKCAHTASAFLQTLQGAHGLFVGKRPCRR